MLEPIFSGISFGLLLSIMLGPVFFTLIQTSLHESFKAAAWLALGVFLSDALMITICYSFASLIRMIDNHQTGMGIFGGLIMIGFGIFNFFKKTKMKELNDIRKTVHAQFVLKGFIMNAVNPAVVFFWLGVVGIVTVKENYTRVHEAFFFGSVLITVLATDLLKGFVANRLKNILKPNVMVWINRVIGTALTIFGIRMIAKALNLF